MKRQELAAGSKPARCFRMRDPVGSGCSETPKETVSITANKNLQSSHGPPTASRHAHSKSLTAEGAHLHLNTLPSLKGLPGDFRCLVSFPPPHAELFFFRSGP